MNLIKRQTYEPFYAVPLRLYNDNIFVIVDDVMSPYREQLADWMMTHNIVTNFPDKIAIGWKDYCKWKATIK